MNPYAAVVLAALLVEFGLHRAADLCNLRALRSEPPPELAHVYDPERYRASQAYARARTRFGMVASAFDLALVLAFWGLGGFGWLDDLVRSVGLGPVPTGLLYVGALLLGLSLAHLPFQLFGTFVLEERFGFNRTDARTFWADRAKGLLLGAALGGSLLAFVLWLFGRFGPGAWLPAWLVVATVSVVLLFVFPTWILPLFHRFEPLGEGELRERLLAYARSVRFPLEGIFVVDGSRRSTKANAFFTGFGRNRRVALFDTLVAAHAPGELVAVVAHEVGHCKKRHVQLGLLLSLAHTGLLLWLFSLFLDAQGLYAAFGVAQPSVYVGLVLFGLLYAPVELVLGLVLQAVSRRNEYAADRFAAETTGEPEALARALERLSADSLTNLTPHPFYVALHHSHPPLRERVAALRARGAGAPAAA